MRSGPRPVHVALVFVLIALAGCKASALGKGPGSTPGQQAAPSPVDTTPPPHLDVTPADGASGVALDTPVSVGITGGQLLGVSVTASTGAATPASLITPGPQPGTGPASLTGTVTGNQWQSAAPLEPGATYAVTAAVTDRRGRPTTVHSTFSTLTPANLLKVSISPLQGMTVGIGMPIMLYLSQPVTDHAAFLSKVTVTSTPPVTGSWHWFSNKEVHYRPDTFWPAGTKVTLDAALAGWDVGGGVWSVTPRRLAFTIGPSHVSTVDANSHQMTVTENGAVVKTVPVSTGRDKYPTDSGVHVVSDKAASVVMDSATVGIPRTSPDGYFETVKWDVRISNSGEFVHAAPWSVADQGHVNVSHGCVNLSPADGQWFYDFSNVGDVVKVVGTPTTLSSTNGIGDWQIPADKWVN